MPNLFDSMDFSRFSAQQPELGIEPRVPRNVSTRERHRREAVVERMRCDPAFADFTPEAQDKLVRAALTDRWETVLPRLPRMGAEV